MKGIRNIGSRELRIFMNDLCVDGSELRYFSYGVYLDIDRYFK